MKKSFVWEVVHRLKRPRKSSKFDFRCSQKIDSSLVSFERIFEALQSELFRFYFHSLSSKVLKTLEINLVIRLDQILNRWSCRISRYPSLILSNFAFAVLLISPITTNDYIHLMKYYGFCKDILHINLEHYHYLQKLWFSSNINIP